MGDEPLGAYASRSTTPDYEGEPYAQCEPVDEADTTHGALRLNLLGWVFVTTGCRQSCVHDDLLRPEKLKMDVRV
jgi:hypothetical protein